MIVVSDHGFAVTSSDHVIRLDEIVSGSVNVRWIINGPIGHAFVESEEDFDSVFSQLQHFGRNNSSLSVYSRSSVPSSYHFNKSPLIGDIVVVAPLGWILSDGVNAHHSPPSFTGGAGNGSFPIGSHGWNNSLVEMRSIFLAMGPNFSHLPKTRSKSKTSERGTIGSIKSALIPAFSSLQIYELLCRILKIDAAPNNATKDDWKILQPWIMLDKD